MTSRRQFLTGLLAASAAGVSSTQERQHTTQPLAPVRQEGTTVAYDPLADVEYYWVESKDIFTFRRHGWTFTGEIHVINGTWYHRMQRTGEAGAEHGAHPHYPDT